jgi:hypothetical protein
MGVSTNEQRELSLNSEIEISSLVLVVVQPSEFGLKLSGTK